MKFIRLGLPVREIPGRQYGGSQSGLKETMLYLPLSLRVRFMRKRKILKPGMTLDASEQKRQESAV